MATENLTRNALLKVVDIFHDFGSAAQLHNAIKHLQTETTGTAILECACAGIL
jgi:hypothetical protein